MRIDSIKTKINTEFPSQKEIIINRIKRWLIHLCGGVTRDEYGTDKKIKINICKTELPIKTYKYEIIDNYSEIISKDYINREAIENLAQDIINDKLYEVKTEKLGREYGINGATRYEYTIRIVSPRRD